MASFPNRFPLEVVLEVLRQRRQPYPEAKRRELADLTVQRAIGEPRVSTDAILTLSMSGSSDMGIGGTPDPDALDRLIRVERNVGKRDEGRLALGYLIDQVNPARALPFLREVAVSTNSDDAYEAISEIGRLAYGVNQSRASPSDRSQAQVLLRELYDKDLVTQWRAFRLMCETAAFQKWPASKRCRGIL